ncbi:hypothetical protein [Streptomyces sp. NPDC086023]|uniref:hypothetical protein n=1 Tax=Streptomyces sp. NPDC086023 TaxID=3365746 RepID=UPI0037CFF84C
MKADLISGQMVVLQRAGVNLTTFRPQLGQVAKTVYQAVEANQSRIRAAGTDRWAKLLKATMPEGLVRDAILFSRPGRTRPRRWPSSTSAVSASPPS